ncbi:MAG TPA: crossover junction endodeoxyribonuclease RuvC [Spirochaetota bacterium]|nr:crossover junction endodeoxyribonuclease RuvC [Spirochaetota bacterium]
MLTIGVDPGLERIGIGIVEHNGPTLRLKFDKLIKTSSKLTTPERLLVISEEMSQILSLYKFDFASVEKLFFARNVTNALLVSEARGVILLELQKRGIPIFEYTPLQVKQALIGYGKGTKEQMQSLVKIILNLDKAQEQDDVADAIALAITHINTNKTMQKLRG